MYYKGVCQLVALSSKTYLTSNSMFICYRNDVISMYILFRC